VPGESAASNLAKKDALLFSDASYVLYSNQYVPLIKDASLCDRVIVQGKFDKEVGGGSILHLNLEEKITKPQMKKLISYASSKGVVYFAINYNYAQCTSCGKVYIGKYEVSPCHNAPVKMYLRVVGFLTEVLHWSKERQGEYKSRVFYKNGSLKL